MNEEIEIEIEELSDEHKDRVGLFYCKYQNIRDYIKDQAYQDAKVGETKTFVAIHKPSECIAGYFSIKCSSLRVEESIDEDETEIFVYPTVEVVMFAVHSELARNGYGTEILANVVLHIFELRKVVGIRGITLFSVPDAIGFYEGFGFKQLPEEMEMFRSSWCADCIPMYFALPEIMD